MNSNGGVIVSASSSTGATATTQQQQISLSTTSGATLKTYFKTHEGRYNLHSEKARPSSLLHYPHATKTLTQVTLARLKERPVPSTPTGQSLGSSSNSGVRSAAARLLGGSSGSRTLSFVGGNGSSKSLGGNGRIGLMGASSSSNHGSNLNFDGKGAYFIINVGDAIFISDLNSQDKDPLKSIHFVIQIPRAMHLIRIARMDMIC